VITIIVLLTTLEKKWNLKICLEDRDFASQAGQSNYDLIANAINNSRHIIFVVTSDFMSKSFAGYEIDQAVMEQWFYVFHYYYFQFIMYN
jgi:hypothetical protein